VGARPRHPLGAHATRADRRRRLAFDVRLRGTLFADVHTYGGDSAPETADSFLLRSVRPTIEGTFGNIYDFRITPDFGSGRSIVVDAYGLQRTPAPGDVFTRQFLPARELRNIHEIKAP